MCKKEAKREADSRFVKYLLVHTNYNEARIAKETGVSVDFVKGLKESLKAGELRKKEAEKRAREAETRFVKYLLTHTNYSDAQIAEEVKVSVDFVKEVKATQ